MGDDRGGHERPIAVGPGPAQGREFRITRHPLAQAAAREFSGGGEEGTLRFFDAVLPHCVRMVDFGAYVGFTALYAATWDADVFAFEPSPTNHELLACNVAENPELAPRIRLFRHGVADGDGYAPLYAEAAAGSGSSVFRDVERRGAVCAMLDAVVPLRDASAVLAEVGIDQRTLLKIDIEGAEYQVLPSIAELLAERKPLDARVVPSVQPGRGPRCVPHGLAAAALYPAGGGGSGLLPLHACLCR